MSELHPHLGNGYKTFEPTPSALYLKDMIEFAVDIDAGVHFDHPIEWHRFALQGVDISTLTPNDFQAMQDTSYRELEKIKARMAHV